MLQVHWLHALIATISAVAGGLLTGLVVYFVAEPVGHRLEAGIAEWHAYKRHRHSTPHAAAVATMFEAPAPVPVSNEYCDHDQQQHTVSEEQEVVNLQSSSFTSSTKDTADDSQPEDPIVMMTNPMLTGITAGLNPVQQTAAPAARAMRHTASLVSFARLDETCDIVAAAPPSDTHQDDGLGSYSMLRQHSRTLSIMSQDMEPSHTASSTSLMYRTLSHVELAALSVPTASIATTDPEAVIQPMSAWKQGPRLPGPIGRHGAACNPGVLSSTPGAHQQPDVRRPWQDGGHLCAMHRCAHCAVCAHVCCILQGGWEAGSPAAVDLL